MSNYILFIVILIGGFVLSCDNDKQVDEQNSIIPTGYFILTTDFENTLKEDKQNQIKTNVDWANLYGGTQISAEYSRSKSQSLKLDSTNQYGLNLKMYQVKAGNYFKMSIYQHSSGRDGALIANLFDDSIETFHSYFVNDSTHGTGWYKHTIQFIAEHDYDSLEIYTFCGKSTAYFDDFTFEKFQEVPNHDHLKTLKIELSDAERHDLEERIMLANSGDMIPAKAKKKVDGKLIFQADTASISLKIKGDLKDHLSPGKESFRIKIEDEQAYGGMKTFSIQHPKTRAFLDEWIIHQIAEKEDLLTTSYDFVNVNFDGVSRGVYALEEHFDKQLLERRKRREGPILKLDESGYWATIERYFQTDSMKMYPYFEESPVDLFKANRTRKSPTLSKQYIEGQKLLRHFKNGSLPIAEIFDIEQLAKMYVLMELAGSNHGLRWHNRRFYYNPINQKLEHIAYDIGPFSLNDSSSLMGMRLNQQVEIAELCFDNQILYDAEFKSQFLFHLNRMTQTVYLDSIFKDLHEEINEFENALNIEFDYVFDKTNYYKRASIIQNEITQLAEIWTDKLLTRPDYEDWIIENQYGGSPKIELIEDISLNSYCEILADSSYEIRIENYHPADILILGYETDEPKETIYLFNERNRLGGFKNSATSIAIPVKYYPEKIIFTTPDNPFKIHKEKVAPWPFPEGQTTRNELSKKFQVHSPYYRLQKDTIYFTQDVEITDLLYVPSTYSVVINPGVTINFKAEGGLVVSNSFLAKGTRLNPIQFIASETSNGITILNGVRAEFTYVNCQGLSNLNYKNWELTGAISIYQTPVTMSHCNFSGNKSEDALNIIRSHFQIDHLKISNTYSDGFDADFCTGTLIKSSFENTGNDAIDFSGSVVDIQELKVEHCGDKAVSGGEASTLKLHKIWVNHAVTGIASKDGSTITGDSLAIQNVEFGFAAFRKKPEYKQGYLSLKNVSTQTFKQYLVIDKEAIININSRKYKGLTPVDVEALYARFEK